MPTRALFVIDIQNSLADDPKTEIPSASSLKSAITSVLSKARQYIADGGDDLKIYIVQHDDEEDDTLRAGSEGWKLVFSPKNDGEKVVRKQVRK
jgi:nicotinamidase-related amidase